MPLDSSAPTGEEPALFVRDGDRFIPTILSQGPWSPDHQFGGSPAALLATVLDDVPSLVPQQLVRVTIDLLRPVPLRPMHVTTQIRREGKRIQVLDASVMVDGVEVVRASALRMRTGDLGVFDDITLPSGHPQPAPVWVESEAGPVAPDRAPHHSFVPGMSGATDTVFDPIADWGAAPVWWRLRVHVIAGESVKGVARLCYIADGVSGVGHPRSPSLSGINADVTVHIVRAPVSEWLCVDGTGWVSPAGIGHSQATISDANGVAASVTLSRLMDRI